MNSNNQETQCKEHDCNDGINTETIRYGSISSITQYNRNENKCNDYFNHGDANDRTICQRKP